MKTEKVIAVRTDKTVYRDGDKVIKVFNENYSKANVLNEALNQARVEETSLNIPKLSDVTRIDGKWCILSQYIEGKTLARLMEEHPEKRKEYLERMVALQMEVLSQRVPMLNKLKDKMHTKINLTDLDATTRYDLHTRLDGMPKHTKVCHGDFCPENIIITPEDEAYIIDWAHVTQGNGAADAARTYLVLWLSGSIDMAEQYLNLFCQKTDTAKQYVQKWIPIVAASQLARGKAAEREFLLHWIDVVDYE